ncbi:PREDICTED: laccase-11 [Prunus dulcis]|uniref:PREDICTED: laccase-11 n=1 Tax=Prunus dulcis TaxID=3755 RepID=A0A5E4FVS6_PRUDU|nr:hypothetical protein L3X38_043356 [Prunus dulcis]VVA31512.1 PREDICTED: laccase-11 [Prunus dulcis]
MAKTNGFCWGSAVLFLCLAGFISTPAKAALKTYQFDVQVKNVTRLCHSKPIVKVNGMIPGPTVYAREGDTHLVNVTNHAQYNMSIHWHGLKQYQNGWVDGPAYISHNVLSRQGMIPMHWRLNRERRTCYESSALNDELFFVIAGHNLIVVEIDAVYTKSFTSQAILIVPGQTTNVLVQANQAPSRYFMAARPFMDAPVSIDNKTATRILQYKGIPNTAQPVLPQLPALNNTAFALSFNAKLRSLNTAQFQASVPLKVDRHLFYTIRLGISQCTTSLNGTQLTASLNNITFVMPQIGLLQAHYFNTKGVFTTDFPDRPPTPFNYTGALLTANLGTKLGTRLSKIAYNSSVELVLQDTNLLTVESYPFHLHGYNFFVVGSGTGNFNLKKDPAKYNLVDPPERNTVGVPTGGWGAIRFRADNPGKHSNITKQKATF